MTEMATDNTDISVAARRAIRSAAAELAPYAAEPQVQALISKLGSIANPVGGDQDAINALSKAMSVTSIAKSDGGLSAAGREHASKAHRELELEYLAMVSPSSSAVRKRDREALGVAE
jgi:hypothetical protein